MTDRPRDAGGAMTGATGNLTPDGTEEPFVPAETREIADPRHQRDVTAAAGRAAPAQRGEVGDPGGGAEGDAPRDAGYGSEHGLAPDDPAYRMERHPSASEQAEQSEPTLQRPMRARGDSDEHHDHEERF